MEVEPSEVSLADRSSSVEGVDRTGACLPSLVSFVADASSHRRVAAEVEASEVAQ